MSAPYWFGLRLTTAVADEAGAPSWGARAIFSDGQVDLVWDRSQLQGAGTAGAQLGAWVDEHGMAALRAWAKDISPGSTLVFIYRNAGYVLKATPRRSHGYMYIGACRELDEDRRLP